MPKSLRLSGKFNAEEARKTKRKEKTRKTKKEVRERFELSTSGFAGLRTTGLYYLTAVKKTQNQQLTL